MIDSRQVTRDALWSFHFHGAGSDVAKVPSAFQPMPLTAAMEHAAGWTDEHAAVRRFNCLRRLYPAPRSKEERAKHPWCQAERGKGAEMRRSFRKLFTRQHFVEDVGRAYRVDLHSTRKVVELADHDFPTLSRCIPRVDDPGFTQPSQQTSLFSKLTVRQPLNKLTNLLDPRCWHNCSDLFDTTYRVRKNDYSQITPDEDKDKIGSSWDGYLYEEAGVGPQALKNILYIDFKVSPSAVDVEYKLYDSLAYEIGGIELPGLMRQNFGYFRARSAGNASTTVECQKTIRYARLTDWSGPTGGGGFDYGDLLNYLAPTFLSVWIYDVTQIVPCCEHVRPTQEITAAKRFPKVDKLKTIRKPT
jgi:hypothetical protein